MCEHVCIGVCVDQGQLTEGGGGTVVIRELRGVGQSQE